MTGIWRTLRLVLLAALGAGYLALDYLASSSHEPPLYAVLIGAIPILVGVFAACWHSSFRVPGILLCLGIVLAVAVNIDRLLAHAAWLYFFQHAGIMASLGVMFGSTLGSHEGALCSRIARIAIAQPLDAHYLRYTWQVTLAWTGYFAASAVTSLLLFAFAPLATWALFASLFTPLSLGLMFGGEYLIRRRVLPGRPDLSIAQTIASYRKYAQCRDGAK